MPSRKFKKLVKTAAAEYVRILPAQHYQIGVIFADEDEEHHTDEGGHDVHAYVEASSAVDRRYLTCKIKVFPQTWKKWQKKIYDDTDVRSIIAHEVAHIATQFMYDIGTATYRDEGEMRDAWESCTTLIGRLLVQLSEKR